MFRKARTTLSKYDTSVDELKRKYGDVGKEDEEFWKEISKILSEAYDAEKPDFNGLEFQDFVKELLRIRFEKEFRKNDVKKLDDSTDIEGFLEEVKQNHNLVIEDGSNKKIIYSGQESSREFSEPLTPVEEEYYPPLLIEVDEDSDELLLSGKRSQRNQFVQATTDYSEIQLKDEEPESYEELELTPGFIHQLRTQDIFLTEIRLKGQLSNINLNVSTDENGAIEINDFIDYDLFLQEKVDILSISKCGMVYVTEERDVEFTLNFQIFKRVDRNEEYIKIALELSSEDEIYRSDLEEILANYGLEVYEPYYLPNEYYFNKFLVSYKNNRPKYYAPLDEMEGDTGLDFLRDKDILDSEGGDEIELDEEALQDEMFSVLEDVTGEYLEMDGREYRITHCEKEDKNRITLILKSFSDNQDDRHERLVRVTIPFRARPSVYEKINTIFLSRIDYHKLLTSDDTSEVLEYLVKATQHHVKYQQELLLEKECRRSVKILENYVSDPTEFRDNYDSAADAGDVVEVQVNVLFRYLFHGFIPGGGSNEPDGLLQLRDDVYFVDSKQSKSIPQTEYTKSKEDILSSELGDILGEEINVLIYVISRGLIVSETSEASLNLDAQRRVSEGGEIEFSFLSIEFLLELYGLFSENKHIINNDTDLLKRIHSEINDLVEENKYISDCDVLEEQEEGTIGDIRRLIDNSNYLPESERTFF